MGRRKLKNIYYIVKGNDILSNWVTSELSDAYKHAVYLSRLYDNVRITEVVERIICEFQEGKVKNE